MLFVKFLMPTMDVPGDILITDLFFESPATQISFMLSVSGVTFIMVCSPELDKPTHWPVMFTGLTQESSRLVAFYDKLAYRTEVLFF